MFYDIDVFGYIEGYVSENWNAMSKHDLLNDKKLKKELEVVQYQNWKRKNLPSLMEKWDSTMMHDNDFDVFCRKEYAKKL